jgi:hypothetical protein
MEDMNVSTTTLDLFNTLSMYDRYIVCNSVRSQYGISTRRLKKDFASTTKVKRWCKMIGTCTEEKISIMIRKWILKFIFFSWLPNLPVENFGTMVASMVTSYDNKDGFEYMIKSILGDKGSIGLVTKPDAEMWPHAADLMQYFIPSAIYSYHKTFSLDNVPRNVPGLAKLFLFPTYVESQASTLGMSPTEVIKAEVGKFGCSKKQTFVVSSIFFSNI